MKASLLRFAVVFSFLFSTQIVRAQAVITEYFDINENVSFNFNDKKAVKSIYTAGVLDVEWASEKRVLAISYDPKQTKIGTIMENFRSITGEFSISINNKTAQQYARKR
jgi:hypothetical protein